MEGRMNWEKSLNSLCYGRFQTYCISLAFAEEVICSASFLAASLNNRHFMKYLDDLAKWNQLEILRRGSCLLLSTRPIMALTKFTFCLKLSNDYFNTLWSANTLYVIDYPISFNQRGWLYAYVNKSCLSNKQPYGNTSDNVEILAF